jgi:molecular chaperone GrpE (heat shock protein)
MHTSRTMTQGFHMTCYFRHLKEVFQKAGIEVTPQNRHQIDKIIHNIVGVEYKNCPATGRAVKKRMTEDETGFIATLKNAWNNQK